MRQREYKTGSEFRYQLTTESFRNNQPEDKTISVSRHTIVRDSGVLKEEVQWISKMVVRKDTSYLDSIAQKVRPYRISLLPGGSLRLPPLVVPQMTGEITDLNTFYVAVSPPLHAFQLGPNRLSIKDSILKGNFSDGQIILKGEDCIEVTQKLLNKEKDITIIESSFLPPSHACLLPYADTLESTPGNPPMNFQMIQKAAGQKINYLWGTEQFVITSTIDNRTGMLLKAEMVNLLNLRMRYNASPDLNTFDAEFPYSIRRVVSLDLLH
jgi:hypothetical protein